MPFNDPSSGGGGGGGGGVNGLNGAYAAAAAAANNVIAIAAAKGPVAIMDDGVVNLVFEIQDSSGNNRLVFDASIPGSLSLNALTAAAGTGQSSPFIGMGASARRTLGEGGGAAVSGAATLQCTGADNAGALDIDLIGTMFAQVALWTWLDVSGRTGKITLTSSMANAGGNHGLTIDTVNNVTTADIAAFSNQGVVKLLVNSAGALSSPTANLTATLTDANSGTFSLSTAGSTSWQLTGTGGVNNAFQSIGTAQTVGYSLRNTTTAAAGAQQNSPVFELLGEGWKTGGPASSQTVAFGLQTQPIQGATNPNGTFALMVSINGVAYSNVLTYVPAATAGNLLSIVGSTNPSLAFRPTGSNDTNAGMLWWNPSHINGPAFMGITPDLTTTQSFAARRFTADTDFFLAQGNVNRACLDWSNDATRRARFWFNAGGMILSGTSATVQSGTIDTSVSRDAASIWGVNAPGTNDDTTSPIITIATTSGLRLYGAPTSTTNYERVFVGYDGVTNNEYLIQSQKGGTGTDRPLTLGAASGRAIKIPTDNAPVIATANAAPTDANLFNGSITFYLDEAGNNLKVRVKYSGGTLKTGTVALV